MAAFRASRHLLIEDRDIGTTRADERDRLLAIRRDPDNLESIVPREQRTKTVPHGKVVVGDHDSDERRDAGALRCRFTVVRFWDVEQAAQRVDELHRSERLGEVRGRSGGVGERAHFGARLGCQHEHRDPGRLWYRSQSPADREAIGDVTIEDHIEHDDVGTLALCDGDRGVGVVGFEDVPSLGAEGDPYEATHVWRVVGDQDPGHFSKPYLTRPRA